MDLYAKESKKELLVNPAKFGDPQRTTSELVAALCHSLLLQSPSPRSTQLWPIDRRSVVI